MTEGHAQPAIIGIKGEVCSAPGPAHTGDAVARVLTSEVVITLDRCGGCGQDHMAYVVHNCPGAPVGLPVVYVPPAGDQMALARAVAALETRVLSLEEKIDDLVKVRSTGVPRRV